MITPASTRRRSGTLSAISAAPMPHSPPIPRLATLRKSTSCHMLVEIAHSAVPTAYRAIVVNNARLRPTRSATQPNNTPPMAQPISNIEVIAPVQNTVAARASAEPCGRPSSAGMQLGETKLKSRASKTSKPQPAQPAAMTSQW